MGKQKMTPRAREEAKWGWLFIAPTMIGLIILNFYPVFNTIYQTNTQTIKKQIYKYLFFILFKPYFIIFRWLL